MNDSINTLFSDAHTQKQFLKNSILNSVIIYKHIIKDYFKHFLGSLSPLSRYEFWGFIFAVFCSVLILSSLLSLISIIIPAFKMYADIIFYIFILLLLNISVRAFACRIISVQIYLENIKSNIKHYKAAYIERIVKRFFINIKTFFAAAYFNILIILLYFIYRILIDYQLYSVSVNNEYFLNIIKFMVFTFQMSAVMYVILLILPSSSSLEYFMDNNIRYYQVLHYYNILSKSYLVDYLTLASGILSVIAVGHLLIIGYTLSCHFIVWLSLLVQSAALIFSNRYFSVIVGLGNFIYSLIYMALMFSSGIVDTFYDSNKVIQILDYYQISFAVLFVGLFYHITFDKDMIKMAAVIGCFFSAIFLWEDHTAIKNILVYDNHTIPVLFYGLTGLLTFFIYLVRVANYKGYYVSDSQIWNDYIHYVNQLTLKHIYMIIFYFSILLAVYAFLVLLYPMIVSMLNIPFFDSYIFSFIHNIRKMITFYIFLGLFLLFRSHQDMFSIFLMSFIVICELYIIIYAALSNVFPAYMIYNIEYLYAAINAVLCVLSVNLVKYSRIMAYGFSLSIILFIISLVNAFSSLSYKNTSFFYYLFFLSLFSANILVSIGAYKKIKQYS